MQPTFRHVPPRNSRSTQATFIPSCAARMAATYPPGPAPMTIRSNWLELAAGLFVSVMGREILRAGVADAKDRQARRPAGPLLTSLCEALLHFRRMRRDDHPENRKHVLI